MASISRAAESAISYRVVCACMCTCVHVCTCLAYCSFMCAGDFSPGVHTHTRCILVVLCVLKGGCPGLGGSVVCPWAHGFLFSGYAYAAHPCPRFAWKHLTTWWLRFKVPGTTVSRAHFFLRYRAGPVRIFLLFRPPAAPSLVFRLVTSLYMKNSIYRVFTLSYTDGYRST